MNIILYSNQSVAYASLRKYSEALTDTKKTVEIKPDLSKGYRLEIDPNNEPLKSGLVDAQSMASWSRAHMPTSSFRDASSSSEMWSKFTAEPTTRPYLQQPNFMRLIVMQTLGVLLNVKLKGKVVGNLDDEDISYIMNMAATYLEMSKIRRELRSDFKMIAKALTRKGTALVKLSKCSKDDELAIETFQKALTEHRKPETLKKLNDAEKAKKELEQQGYFDLQKADEEREKGLPILSNLTCQHMSVASKKQQTCYNKMNIEAKTKTKSQNNKVWRTCVLPSQLDNVTDMAHGYVSSSSSNQTRVINSYHPKTQNQHVYIYIYININKKDRDNRHTIIFNKIRLLINRQKAHSKKI
ncbi:hypothetical protein UlMin_037681 [Ulmus minor]